MHILVLNAGSSSLKVGMFRSDGGIEEILRATYDRFGDGACEERFWRAGSEEQRRTAGYAGIAEAAAAIPDVLERLRLAAPDAIGHRVVHGGDRFPAPAIIDEPTLHLIEALTPLAPLHNPVNLDMIRLCGQVWPSVPQVAVFDTSFHLSSPAFANTYAVPKPGGRPGCAATAFTAFRTATSRNALPRRSDGRSPNCGSSACIWGAGPASAPSAAVAASTARWA